MVHRLKIRSSTHLPRFSLPFRSRPRRTEPESATDEKAKGKEEQTDPAAVEESRDAPEGESEPAAKETKSRSSKTFFRLRKSSGAPRGTRASPSQDEDRSPLPGSRAKKGVFPQLGEMMSFLFREPLVGQGKSERSHEHDHHNDDGEVPYEKERHSTSERHSKSFALFAGRRSYERALLYRPATSLGVRLSTSSDRAPLLAQAQMPYRGPTTWSGISSGQYEGRRSFNVRRKPVPLFDLEEEVAVDEPEPESKPQAQDPNEPQPEIEPESQALCETELETQAVDEPEPESKPDMQAFDDPEPRSQPLDEAEPEAEPEPEMQALAEPEPQSQLLHEPGPDKQALGEPEPVSELQSSSASSIDFPRRPQLVRFETSNGDEARAWAPTPARRARCDALIPARRLRPVTEENSFIESDYADDEHEEETIDGHQWARRAQYLAEAREGDRVLDLYRNDGPPRLGLAPPPPRPQVEMLAAGMPTSPNEGDESSANESGSSGGTPALLGLGISLNTGSGTFGVGVGSPISPTSTTSPISPADTESPGQQLLTPTDAVHDERTHSGLAALCTEEGQGKEDAEEDAGSDWHEVLCV